MKRLDLAYILCPIDFSARSTVALATAGSMARARDAELRSVHVVPVQGAAAPEGLGTIEHQAFMSRLRTALSEAAPGYGRMGAAVRQGDPATEILRFARAMPAGLIVIGAPGADRPERPMGPVASVVVARSQCPVLTVPPQAIDSRARKTGLFRRIICAVDPTPSSAVVIRQALSLAWETQGHLTCVCACGRNAPADPSAIRDGLLAAIPADASRWCETDVVVAKGRAGAEIVGLADEQDADVVVIGAPRRWTSTTHAVLRGSRCPVLITHDARPLPWPADLAAGEFERATKSPSRGVMLEPVGPSAPRRESQASEGTPAASAAVDEALEGSFPASDPPSWTSGIARLTKWMGHTGA
jgi:nucleotide-binding universal stress UspA family protein